MSEPRVIWVIQHTGWVDCDYEYEDTGTDIEDEGWYATQEAAQAECDRRNEEVRKRYDKYVEEANQQNEIYLRTYQEAVLDYQALIAAGRPAKAPRGAYSERVREFPEWHRRTYQHTCRPISITCKEDQ